MEFRPPEGEDDTEWLAERGIEKNGMCLSSAILNATVIMAENSLVSDIWLGNLLVICPWVCKQKTSRRPKDTVGYWFDLGKHLTFEREADRTWFLLQNAENIRLTYNFWEDMPDAVET
jgi:hypothetical protein